MNERINTGNPIFYRMQEDFSEGLTDAITRMIRHGVNQGKVTCTITITLVEDEIMDERGLIRPVKTPVFEHRVKTAVSQGIKIEGNAQMRGTEIDLDEDGNPYYRRYGGQMTLEDLEDDDEG